MAVSPSSAIPLDQGKEVVVFNETATAAGSKSELFSIDADTILVSVQASVLSGTFDVTAYTVGLNGVETPIITFPSLTSPTTALLIKKAAASMQKVRLEATYTGATTFHVRARGVGSGESSVKILGSSTADNFSTAIGTSASLIVPVSLDDRDGISVVNNNSTGILYVGFNSSVTVTPGVDAGTPVHPGGSLGINVAAGVTLYGIASAGTIDVRIIETGG